MKGYNSFDPYPGYSKVHQDVVDARTAYVENLEESIDDLAEHRDRAVERLREANDEVHRHINDSVDALYGHQALTSGVAPFLEQCDIAANYLLAVYRDANKAARSVPPPAHFNQKHAFSAFDLPELDEGRRTKAEDQVREVSDLVNAAIREIFSVFEDAVRQHYDIDELEGTEIKRRPLARRSVQPVQTTPDEALGATT